MRTRPELNTRGDLPLTESEFQRQLLCSRSSADDCIGAPAGACLAHVYGYRGAHVRPARRGSGSTWSVPMTGSLALGWPDLCLIKPGRFVMAELKSETGRGTSVQEEVLEHFRQAGVEAYVWRPSDWDQINRILSGSAPF